MSFEPSVSQAAELRALLLAGRYAIAIRHCCEHYGASLEEGKAFLGAMLADARQEFQTALGSGKLTDPPRWLLDAYCEALVHPYTGSGLSASAQKAATGLPEALRLEAFCRASALHNLAYELAIEVYDGRRSEHSILPQLRRELPGFGARAYQTVIDLAQRDAR